MNPQEALTVLAVAALVDPRVGAASDADKVGKAAVWAAALDHDMPADWARNFVPRHYAELTTVIMPADLNHAWRQELRKRREAERTTRQRMELEAANARSVPMPDHVREQLAALKRSWSRNG